MSGLDVLVASDDRSFLRLAAAVLGNDGHTTTRTSVSARRVERLVRLVRPDVLVLDAEEDPVLVAEVCSVLLGTGLPIALVLVCDEPRDGDLPVVARWGSPESLLDAVRAAAPAADPEPPAPAPAPAPSRALRLVP